MKNSNVKPTKELRMVAVRGGLYMLRGLIDADALCSQ